MKHYLSRIATPYDVFMSKKAGTSPTTCSVMKKVVYMHDLSTACERVHNVWPSEDKTPRFDKHFIGSASEPRSQLRLSPRK